MLHGVDRERRLLYLQRIYEPTLQEMLPDASTLLGIKKYLFETIRIIHEHGWCHGDIHRGNIFASGLLFDFSNAYPKSKLSTQAWEDYKKKDRRNIQSCYSQMIKLKNLEVVIVFLNSGVDELPRQKELAELLSQSETSSELVDKLRQISDPIPCLALKISQVFRYRGQYSEARRLLKESNLPIPCDDQSRRLYVQIQRELAICESYLDDCKACPLYADAVRFSIDLLSRTDEHTIQIRVDFAAFLERSCRYSGALDVLSTLKVDTKDLLHPWRGRIIQMEERLRNKRGKKRPRERPMPAEQTLIKDDKENMYQSESHSLSKKPKLM